MNNKETPLTFKNENGKQLVGVLHSPEQGKPPLVIVCHGFDGTKTDRKFIELARALQKEGIATFRFDFEGCGDSEGKFEEMTIKKEASDLNSAITAVLKEGDLNSQKIALVGHSLGAVVATLFLKNFKVPVKILVFWNQAFNQERLFKVWHTEDETKNWERNGFLIKGDKKMGKEYLEENKDKDWSSLLSEIPETPILLVQGKEDEDVPPEFSERLAEHHQNIKLEVLPLADHKFKDFTVRQELINLTVNWLRKHLS